MRHRNGSEPCVFCCGTGYVDTFDEAAHDWDEEVCDDCGGTGIEDDQEGE